VDFLLGWYGSCISITLKLIDDCPTVPKLVAAIAGAILLIWTVVGVFRSVPEPRDLGTFEMVEKNPLFKLLLAFCTHAIIVVFARAQLATLKQEPKEPEEHLLYPCLLPFIVGKFFLIARMFMAYSNHDMGIAIDYFVKQEAILIAVHALVAAVGVPLIEKWFQDRFGDGFQTVLQARFCSVLLADSVKTGIMFIFYFALFSPGLIASYFNRLPDEYTQIAVAVLIHIVLDVAQALVTFFMFYIGRFGRDWLGVTIRGGH